MRSDIDQLMQEQGMDVLLITGSAQHNAMMTYFTGAVHVSDADLIKKRGSKAVLFCNAMEREEGALSGLKVIPYSKYPMSELAREAHGDFVEAYAIRYEKMFTELGIESGSVAVYGLKDVGLMHSVFTRLEKRMPRLSFNGFMRDEILLQAMMTKEEDELDHIRRMGKITTDVVGRTADFLTGHKAEKGMLVHSDGSPLLIGEVKQKINLWLAEAGAENPEGTIFAIGRDAGVPHNMGKATDAMRLGQTIVYDIYPCEPGGGYFYDFTRTWCLGYASDEILKLYEDVKSTYDILVSELKMGQNFCDSQKRTCELFEAKGHVTIMTNEGTQSGYVHSVGHGIGLQVHEKPWSTMIHPSPSDVLAPGSVFTMEPGLYYPEKGMGVRIEDSFTAHADGKIERLAEYPYDLILPIK
jgi:Xaa-Pro aminopeptidase